MEGSVWVRWRRIEGKEVVVVVTRLTAGRRRLYGK
jgi:hypothetical protein